MGEPDATPRRRHDHHILIDAEEDDWAWRRRIRANPRTRAIYRVFVFLLGLVIIVGGLALVPLPGPGWFIVIFGLVIWASEFERAQRVRDWVVDKVKGWNDWVQAQALWLRALMGLLLMAFVLTIIWATLRVSGVPAFLPDGWERFLHSTARL